MLVDKCVQTHVCGGQKMIFQELVPSDQTRGLRLAGKYVIQLSYLYRSQNYFPKKI